MTEPTAAPPGPPGSTARPPWAAPRLTTLWVARTAAAKSGLSEDCDYGYGSAYC